MSDQNEHSEHSDDQGELSHTADDRHTPMTNAGLFARSCEVNDLVGAHHAA